MGKQQNKKYYILNREKYKAIKKFDHLQMETFCSDIYKSGFQDGRNSVPGVDIEKVMLAIAEVKGIGAKRMDEVRKAVETCFKEGGGNDEK